MSEEIKASNLLQIITEADTALKDLFKLIEGSKNIRNTLTEFPEVVEKFDNVDHRIDVVLGGDYLTSNDNSGATPSNYATGDFILDYFFSEEKKLKIRIYGRSDWQIIDGRRQRIGSGFHFRKEFSELNLKSLRKSHENATEEILKEKQ